MSIADLSHSSGVAKSTIYSLEENDLDSNPRMKSLINLAASLNVTLDYLVYDDFNAFEQERIRILIRNFNLLNETNKRQTEFLIALLLGKNL